ncbi:hypothetical protein [Streptomyces sp. NPDC091040]|uniref:hypothetical protein n=1 Tax=Streptomyces sp. NPDC091040 TaxID=3365972 RepID=UPI0037F96CB9
MRRGALALLIEGGGLDALDARDRMLVERLLRVKLPGGVRAVPDTQLSAWWLAVPGATYEGVFGALGLHDPRPVPVQTGVAAAMCEEIPNPSPDDPSRGISRAFVTPELDGWRLGPGREPRPVPGRAIGLTAPHIPVRASAHRRLRTAGGEGGPAALA